MTMDRTKLFTEARSWAIEQLDASICLPEEEYEKLMKRGTEEEAIRTLGRRFIRAAYKEVDWDAQ